MKSQAVLMIVFMLVGATAFSKTNKNSKTADQQPRMVIIQQKSDFIPHLRINGYTFYAFDDHVDSYYSSTEYFNGKIRGGFQWGGGFEYMMAPVQGIEISYLRLDTNAPMEYYDNGRQCADRDVATHYIMLGGNRYFPTGGKAEHYAGAQLGVAIFNIHNPETRRSDTATKFSWGLKAGLNIWASERVGLKIQTGLISAVQAIGGGMWFGSGGAGGGINTYSSFFQFYIGGGLCFDLAK